MKYEKVLFATDGSRLAEHALPAAVELARRCGAQLRCLTVVEPPPYYGPPDLVTFEDAELYRGLAEELETMARSAVERAASGAVHDGVPATTALRHGTAAEEIVAEGEEWEASVIVLGTHGRAGLSRLVLGSLAGKVARTASCPVLLCRKQEDGD